MTPESHPELMGRGRELGELRDFLRVGDGTWRRTARHRRGGHRASPRCSRSRSAPRPRRPGPACCERRAWSSRPTSCTPASTSCCSPSPTLPRAVPGPHGEALRGGPRAGGGTTSRAALPGHRDRRTAASPLAQPAAAARRRRPAVAGPRQPAAPQHGGPAARRLAVALLLAQRTGHETFFDRASIPSLELAPLTDDDAQALLMCALPRPAPVGPPPDHGRRERQPARPDRAARGA